MQVLHEISSARVQCKNRIQLECMHLKMRLGLAFHQKCQLVPQSQYTLQIQYRLSIESNTSSQRLAKWLDSRWLRQNKEWTIRFHRHSRAKQKYVLWMGYEAVWTFKMYAISNLWKYVYTTQVCYAALQIMEKNPNDLYEGDTLYILHT